MLVGKKWRNMENIRGKRGGEKLKNAEMRGINNNMRCFEISHLLLYIYSIPLINNNMRCFEIQVVISCCLIASLINNNMRCFEM